MKLWSKESCLIEWLLHKKNDFWRFEPNLYTKKKITKLKVENYLFDKFEKIPHVRLAKYYEKKIDTVTSCITKNRLLINLQNIRQKKEFIRAKINKIENYY